MLWDIGIPSFLEMSEDVTDLLLTNVSVHGNFMACHFGAKTDDDPLDGFRNSLSWRHDGGES